MRRLVNIARYIGILAIFSLGFASTILAVEPTTANAGESSAVQLGVIQATNISHIQLNTGQPLPPGQTVYFLHVVRLALYRLTVQACGDVDLEKRTYLYDEIDAKLELDIKPFTNRNHMTLGSSFCGVWELMQSMLRPNQQGDGFFETDWMISKRRASGHNVPMGYIDISNAGTPQ